MTEPRGHPVHTLLVTAAIAVVLASCVLTPLENADGPRANIRLDRDRYNLNDTMEISVYNLSNRTIRYLDYLPAAERDTGTGWYQAFAYFHDAFGVPRTVQIQPGNGTVVDRISLQRLFPREFKQSPKRLTGRWRLLLSFDDSTGPLPDSDCRTSPFRVIQSR